MSKLILSRALSSTPLLRSLLSYSPSRKEVKACVTLLGLSALCIPQGCAKVSASITTSCQVSGTNAGACTVGGTVGVSTQAVVNSMSTSDLGTLTDGSYVVSESLPSAAFAVDTTQTATTTINVTTDTGYSSSITLTLTPTTAAANPVNSGDSVYSWNLPASDALNQWIQQVQANTASTSTVTGVTGLPFTASQAGNFTITTLISSNTTGSSTVADATQRIGPSTKNTGCPAGMQQCTQ